MRRLCRLRIGRDLEGGASPLDSGKASWRCVSLDWSGHSTPPCCIIGIGVDVT